MKKLLTERVPRLLKKPLLVLVSLYAAVDIVSTSHSVPGFLNFAGEKIDWLDSTLSGTVVLACGLVVAVAGGILLGHQLGAGGEKKWSLAFASIGILGAITAVLSFDLATGPPKIGLDEAQVVISAGEEPQDTAKKPVSEGDPADSRDHPQSSIVPAQAEELPETPSSSSAFKSKAARSSSPCTCPSSVPNPPTPPETENLPSESERSSQEAVFVEEEREEDEFFSESRSESAAGAQAEAGQIAAEAQAEAAQAAAEARAEAGQAAAEARAEAAQAAAEAREFE